MPIVSEAGRVRLVIAPDERAVIVGKTGSGKTYLARYLLAPARRLVVCDPKGRIDPAAWRLVDAKKGLPLLRKGKAARVRVADILTDDDWEQLFWEVYKIGNVRLYIDELYGVGPAAGSPGLRALYTRGRELGIGVISATQRPKFIPLYALSEAEWIIQFQLRMQTDLARMAEITGNFPSPPLTEHSFVIYNDHMERALRCDRLNIRAPGAIASSRPGSRSL